MAGWILRRWQAIPIDRDKPDASSLKLTIRLLKEGKKVLIFPEGTRSPDDNLMPAEAGVGMFIAKSEIGLRRIFGSRECFPRGGFPYYRFRWVIFGGRSSLAMARRARNSTKPSPMR